MDTTQDNEYHLTPKQVVMRILSVIVCGLGVSACIFSLSIQIEEAGTMMASAVWFAGLFAVVFALAGYVVSCDPGAGRGHVPIAAICVFAIGITGIVLERIFLYNMAVALIGVAAAAVEAAALIIYHFILKAHDPDAL